MDDLHFLTKYKKSKSAKTDEYLFQFHYKLTFALLVMFSTVVLLKQFVGDPITCQTAQSKIRDKVLDDFCWVSTTFTLPGSGLQGVDVPFPGLENSVPGTEPIVHHAYYQWVSLFLFFQAIMFYVPRTLWTYFEDGIIGDMILHLDEPVLWPKMDNDVTNDYSYSFKDPDEVQDEQTEAVANYIRKSHDSFNRHSFIYFLCEVLNLANVIVQIFFTDAFLGGQFTKYGLDVIRHSGTEIDPLVTVFPKVTKCTFNSYGPSGSVQNLDAICVLPTNIFNEKIFTFLWFYFIALSIVYGLWVLYDVLRILSVKVSALGVVSDEIKSFNKHVDVIQKVLNTEDRYGLWYLLRQLDKNIDGIHLNAVIRKLKIKNDDQSKKKAENDHENDNGSEAKVNDEDDKEDSRTPLMAAQAP